MTDNCTLFTIVGADQFLAVICMTIWPDSTTDGITTFIYNEGGGVHTRDQVSRRLKDMDVTWKVESTEAYEAFSPECLLCTERFWNRPPLLGVVRIDRRRLIIVDEFAVSLNKCN